MAAQLALPLHAPVVTPEQEARVHAYIDNILPPGVPPYVRRVLDVAPLDQAALESLRPHAVWMGPAPKGFVATVEVFDGGTLDVTITGPLGGAGYSWRFAEGGAPFGWEARRRKWVRYPKLAAADDE
jgi:hypothetical protein